jgi:hypothetical protein
MAINRELYRYGEQAQEHLNDDSSISLLGL